MLLLCITGMPGVKQDAARHHRNIHWIFASICRRLAQDMKYDFDTVIPRRGQGNIKYDRRPELDPFLVEDMDFA